MTVVASKGCYSSHVLLLTGTPGVGKTTVIRKVAGCLPERRLGGFYTEEIRKQGQRRGFRLVTFDGWAQIIAHVDFPKDHRVGRYGVDLSALDEGVEVALALKPTVEIYLVDEIGKMECLSPCFNQAMRRLLASDKTIVATVALKGSGLIAELKRREDSPLWEVKLDNRDILPDQVLCWLNSVNSRHGSN